MTAVKSVLLALALGAPAAIGAPRPLVARAVQAADEGNPACISWVQRAPYRNAGYDHEVEITSRCDRTAQCVVSTDVNPEPIDAEVDPGASVTVLTFRGSPAYAFTARVVCRLEK